jgi:lantibiotic leader peptide-processing serine protease
MVRRILPSLVVAATLIMSGCADQNTMLTPEAALDSRTPAASTGGRYLVGFDEPTEIPASVLAASGGRVVGGVAKFNVVTLDGVTNPDALQMAKPRYIESGFEVTLDVEKESTMEPLVVPGPGAAPWVESGLLWGMKAMSAEAGWASTNGGQGINICIVDSGVDNAHQDLSARVTLRANFHPTSLTDDDLNGHGSHVAGTTSGSGMVLTGVAPRSNVMAGRVFAATGGAAETWIVNAMNWCVDNGAHVINMSLGGVRYLGQSGYITSPITYGAAVDYATANGVVVVVSAGNSNTQLPNPNQIFMPAQVPGTIIVGATGPLSKSTASDNPTFNPFNPNNVWRSVDNRAYYTNFGEAIHVFAPGGRGGIRLSEPYRRVDNVLQGKYSDNIWSICSGQTNQTGAGNVAGGYGNIGSCLNNTGRYIAYAGTSMAAPHVAGMAAVLYGELGGTRSVANRARVENCIKTTTDDIGPSSTYGGGRVNVQKALAALAANQC